MKLRGTSNEWLATAWKWVEWAGWAGAGSGYLPERPCT